jgi:hypothetical protein
MPHLRDDAPNARKLRRPATLLVATISSCGKKKMMPGDSPVKKVASRKNDFFSSGDGAYGGLNCDRLQRQPSNARGFRKQNKKGTKEFTGTDRKVIQS